MAGALLYHDSIEVDEQRYPILITERALVADSGGAGKFRGGSGTAWEVEPLDGDMLCIGFGEGRRIPAMGAAGAYSTDIDTKVGRDLVSMTSLSLDSLARERHVSSRTLRRLIEAHTELSAASGTDQNRRRCCQAKSTRAGDDQDRDGRGKRRSRRCSGQ